MCTICSQHTHFLFFRFFCFDSLGSSEAFVNSNFPTDGKVYYNRAAVQSSSSHECAW